MDFLTNLVSVGIVFLLALLIIGSLIVTILVGYLLGDSTGHSEVGFYSSLLIWAWIVMSLLTSTEFETWIGSVI
jgi:hypothetical protein